MTNIVLCGGNGTRLWPLSRILMPKQFIKLFNEKSLFELSIERNAKFCDKTLIVCNEEQYFLALEQSINTPISKIILEPFARNTAGAITLACLSCDKDELVLVTPSDHLIKNESAYHDVIHKSCELAKLNHLVTFGIKPKYPETGYGYIKFTNDYQVLGFYEKPNLQKAQEFFKEGSYLWNAGIFVFKAGFYLEEIQKFANEVYQASLKAYENAIKYDNVISIKPSHMQRIPNISIDYALMEKSKELKVIPSDIDWSDVGSFESLSKEFLNSQISNYSNARSEFVDCSDNFIHVNNKKKFIAAIDVKDLIVIDTDDALLISKKSSTQKVKSIYEYIKNDKNLSKNHLKTYRPWGSFTILEDENGYKIKRIEVKPGKRLSLQKHFHRNEHWIVLSGTASVEVDGVMNLVRPNESIYIKMGQVHRLSNEGKIPIILIEVQVGEYTQEDDIIRIEDDFKRK